MTRLLEGAKLSAMTQLRFSQGPRGIDHLVVAGHELVALAAFYQSIGFQVGARNRHPWGTENHIIQFDGAFVELIGVGAGATIPDRAPRQYSFGAFVRDYIAGGEGLAMLALEGHNAVGDALMFRKQRIGDFEPFSFERKGADAAGHPRVVGFSLAFAEMQGAPRAGFFTCQQHFPQNFWAAERQRHANGVTGITSVTLVAEDPSDHHEFLGAFIGQREMRAVSGELELDTGRGLISVLSPELFRYRFGEEPPLRPGAGTQFAAITFAGADRAALNAAAARHGVALRSQGSLGIIPASAAHGVVLAFGG